VGGTVRDIFLGKSGVDIDLASAHSAQDTLQRLVRSGVRVVETGLKHGTITAVVEKNNIEITSFRNQSSNSPSIEQDLGGRDFTINALAFSLATLELIDPFDGVKDLDQALLRTVGDPVLRLKEDPLRIMRLVRFGPSQARSVDQAALTAVASMKAALAEVSVERIRTELEKILLSSHAGAGVRALMELELLDYTIPELKAALGFEQNEFHIHDVFEHTLWVIDRCPLDLTLRLSALFHDLGKPATLSVDDQGRRHFYKHEQVSTQIAKQRMKTLKFSNKQIDDVACIVDLHMRPVNCGPAGARRLLRELGDNFEAWMDFKRADAPPKVSDSEVSAQMADFERLVQSEKERLAKLGGSNLAIGGDDLIRLGVKPGVQMGKILRALNELIIETPELNNKEDLIKHARQLAS